jgi:hypothetical protein
MDKFKRGRPMERSSTIFIYQKLALKTRVRLLLRNPLNEAMLESYAESYFMNHGARLDTVPYRAA